MIVEMRILGTQTGLCYFKVLLLKPNKFAKFSLEFISFCEVHSGKENPPQAQIPLHREIIIKQKRKKIFHFSDPNFLFQHFHLNTLLIPQFAPLSPKISPPVEKVLEAVAMEKRVDFSSQQFQWLKKVQFLLFFPPFAPFPPFPLSIIPQLPLNSLVFPLSSTLQFTLSSFLSPFYPPYVPPCFPLCSTLFPHLFHLISPPFPPYSILFSPYFPLLSHLLCPLFPPYFPLISPQLSSAPVLQSLICHLMVQENSTLRGFLTYSGMDSQGV